MRLSKRRDFPFPSAIFMSDQETNATTFLHLSAGLRYSRESDNVARFWPIGKNLGVEVSSFPFDEFGEIITSAGLRCIGNEEKVCTNGYESRFWNPALLPDLGQDIADWPGNDWAALGNSHREQCEKISLRHCTAASFHLRAASLRLMNISDWYHQMLLFAHLNGSHDQMSFKNQDHDNFLVDCHSFLNEAGSARDHIAAYASGAIAGVTKIDSFEKLHKQRDSLPDSLKSIVLSAAAEFDDRLTINHIGKYRNAIVHKRPIAMLSKGLFDTVSFDLGLNNPVLGVRYDIQVWPNKEPDIKFDALRSFHAMMRVLYVFGREVISLAPIPPKLPVFTPQTRSKTPSPPPAPPASLRK